MRKTKNYILISLSLCLASCGRQVQPSDSSRALAYAIGQTIELKSDYEFSDEKIFENGTDIRIPSFVSTQFKATKGDMVELAVDYSPLDKTAAYYCQYSIGDQLNIYEFQGCYSSKNEDGSFYPGYRDFITPGLGLKLKLVSKPIINNLEARVRVELE